MMKIKDLLREVDIINCSADMDLEIHGISYDTRKLKPGDLFVAIRGHVYDGHGFIEKALDKGAVCVISECAPLKSCDYIIVKDSRAALALISAAWFDHPADKLLITAVTGTNGKTTVSTMIKRIVEYCGCGKAGLIGTNGNMIGDRLLHTEHTTPESYELQRLLAMMVDEGCSHAIMEVSSHALAMQRVHGISFEVGVFTNLSPEHLDFHNSMEEYARVKSTLFSSCRHAAINIDDEYAPLMVKNAVGSVLTYAINDDSADIIGKSIKLWSDRVEFCALSIGVLSRIELYIPGLFTVYNALSAMAACLLLDVSIDCIVPALQIFESVVGRAEVVPTGTDYTVLIDYAHTPDALYNIIAAVREYARGRVVTLFGCGGDRDGKKRPVMGNVAVRNSDLVIVTSDNPRTEEPGKIIADILTGMSETKTPYIVIENRREAINWAIENAQSGDVLILAGKGHETYQIVGTEKKHFDEREIIAEFFRSREKSQHTQETVSYSQ